MNGFTLDLFAAPPEASLSEAAVDDSAQSDDVRLGRVIPADRMKMLESLFGVRKGAFKLLSGEQRSSLARAVDVLVTSRDAAYALAMAGKPVEAFGWMTKKPELAEATAMLNACMLDLNSLPMSMDTASEVVESGEG